LTSSPPKASFAPSSRPIWLKGLEVVNVARPIVEGLRDATGETAALFSLQEDRGVGVLEYESRQVLSISRGVGDSMKITQGATGKAMLAFTDAQRQANFSIIYGKTCCEPIWRKG
jgi:DNA-binding IclR family transcriptional regulator